MRTEPIIRNKTYKYLEFREGKRTPYLRGTNINFAGLWTWYNVNKKNYSSLEDFAHDGDHPLDAIKEGFAWCQDNNGEVTKDCEEERRRGGLKD